jgi:hypothetical protein
MAIKKKARSIVTLEQWVQIRIRDGKTDTKLYPPNETLLERKEKMDPPPNIVYRRLNFVDGVPPEYYWATNDVRRREFGGHGIQRMSVETWLQTIAEEKRRGTGHLGPCSDPLPRPKERGGCDCPACTFHQRRLEEREAKEKKK